MGKVKKEKKKMSKKTKIVIICVSVALALALILSAGAVWYFNTDYFEKRTVEKYKNVISTNEKDGDINIEGLKALNSDATGWLTISGTEIDYPVFKTDNNAFYATHNANKEESSIGSLYFDVNNTFGKSASKNLVIYGQNSENGMMFGSLKNYENIEFLKTNPIINLGTESGNQPYVIFAVYKTNAFKKDNNDYCFNYRPSTFSTEEAFVEWTENIKLRSIFNTGVKINKTDTTLTLVTFGDNYSDERLVVCAKSINSALGEGALKFTEQISENAKVNENAIYPAKWYEVNNKEMPSSVKKIYKSEQQKIAEIEKQLSKEK